MHNEASGVTRRRALLAVAGALVAGTLLPAAPAAAQAGYGQDTYRREVFQYQRNARPDPFRSLLGSVNVGVRVEDLALRGIVFNENPRESVAILVENGSSRRIRARMGERIGAITVVAIHPRRVDLIIEDFGISRRESLYLKAETETGNQS